MSELTCELNEWEKRALERRRRPACLSIEVEGDEVTLAGPACVVKNVVDLSLLPYVEFDGLIRTRLHDPISHRARQAVNELLHMIWRKKKKAA